MAKLDRRATGATSGICVSKPIFHSQASTIDVLSSSGFDQVIAYFAHVGSNSDIAFSCQTLAQNGKFVSDFWIDHLGDLEGGTSTVENVQLMLYTDSFVELRKLIFPEPSDYPDHPQTGPNTLLFRNFEALKKGAPVVDGFNFDDEGEFDLPTTVAFSNMLHEIGFQVGFNVYDNIQFWLDCLKQLESSTPGLVEGIYLQTYGGASVTEWYQCVKATLGDRFDPAIIRPGVFSIRGSDCDEGNCPGDVEKEFEGWRDLQLSSGWLWNYGNILSCSGKAKCPGPATAAAYSKAIKSGLG